MGQGVTLPWPRAQSGGQWSSPYTTGVLCEAFRVSWGRTGADAKPHSGLGAWHCKPLSSQPMETLTTHDTGRPNRTWTQSTAERRPLPREQRAGEGPIEPATAPERSWKGLVCGQCKAVMPATATLLPACALQPTPGSSAAHCVVLGPRAEAADRSATLTKLTPPTTWTLGGPGTHPVRTPTTALGWTLGARPISLSLPRDHPQVTLV